MQIDFLGFWLTLISESDWKRLESNSPFKKVSKISIDQSKRKLVSISISRQIDQSKTNLNLFKSTGRQAVDSVKLIRWTKSVQNASLCLVVGLGWGSGSGSISGSWHCPSMIFFGGKQGGVISAIGKK